MQGLDVVPTCCDITSNICPFFTPKQLKQARLILNTSNTSPCWCFVKCSQSKRNNKVTLLAHPTTNKGILAHTTSKCFKCSTNSYSIFEYMILFHISMTCFCLLGATYSLHFIIAFFEIRNTHNRRIEDENTTSMTLINKSSRSVTKTFGINFSDANISFNFSNAHVKFPPFHVSNRQIQTKTSTSFT